MPARTPVRARNNPLTIRLNEHERALLEEIAKREGLSMSEVVRYLLRRYNEANGARSRKSARST